MGFYGNATYYLPNGIAQDVVDGVVTESKLAKDAVTTDKIKNGVIIGDKIKNSAITGDKISANTIKGGPTGSGHLALNTITNDNMADNSINTDQVVNEAITTEKIADLAITRDKIKEEAVSYEEIAPGSILGRATNNESLKYYVGHIVKESVAGGEEGDIASETIQGYNIMKETIQGAGENNNMEESHIGATTIGQINMADNSIGADQIISGEIHGSGDDENYSDYQHIAPGSIGTDDIADNSITEDKLANKFLKIAHYTDQEQPTTLQEISDLLRNSYGGTNTLVSFVLVSSIDTNSAVQNGLTPGDYQAHPQTFTNSFGAPGTWYLNNLTTNEHWRFQTYGNQLTKILIEDNSLTNTYLKTVIYKDTEAPTTLADLTTLFKSYSGQHVILNFYLNLEEENNAATNQGLTNGSYYCWPMQLEYFQGETDQWYMLNVNTKETWKFRAYHGFPERIYTSQSEIENILAQMTNQIKEEKIILPYLRLSTEIYEYLTVEELKADLDLSPEKMMIIAMPQANSNLPSGRYVVLPTHESMNYYKPNRVLIHLTSGITYTLRTSSNNKVIVQRGDGHPNTNSEWLTFNQFNETEDIVINEKTYGSGKIMLYNQYQYKNLPIHIWNWTYLVAQLNLSTFSDENKSFTTKCTISGKLPAIGSIKNTTGKQLQFSTGQKIPSGASLNLPNPKDLEGNEIVDSELIKNYGYQIYMELVDFDSDTILCNIQYFQGLNRDLFSGAIIS